MANVWTRFWNNYTCTGQRVRRLFVYVFWCHTHIMMCFCFACFRLVYPVLPVSLDCSFLIAHSVFSNVYLSTYCCFIIGTMIFSSYKLISINKNTTNKKTDFMIFVCRNYICHSISHGSFYVIDYYWWVDPDILDNTTE